jgi:gentisate 1,2-dioxygenase
MERGDFIITPSWSWHSHGNDTSQTMIWMDGLDVPIVNLVNTSFFEHYSASDFPTSRPAGDSEVRYGSGGLLPDGDARSSQSTSQLNYRYQQARIVLDDLHRRGPADPWHGVKLRYVNPLTGGPAMPTMSAAIQLIPAGFSTAPYSTTESQVFAVLEGKGRTQFDGQSLDWVQNDIFVVPSWTPYRLVAESETVLFSFSDRAAQEKLGIWREQPGSAS